MTNIINPNLQVIICAICLLFFGYFFISGISKISSASTVLLVYKMIGFIIAFLIALGVHNGSTMLNKRVENIEKQVAKNNYEDHKLRELQDQLKLLKSTPANAKIKIDVSPNPTDKELQLLLEYLAVDIISIPGSDGPLNVNLPRDNFQMIVSIISKIFARTNRSSDFENLIMEVVTDKMNYSFDQKNSFVHGVKPYLETKNPFEKTDIYLTIIENSRDFSTTDNPDYSASVGYFVSFLNSAYEQNKNKLISLINNTEFVNRLEKIGLISDFNKKNRQLSHIYALQKLSSEIKDSYLLKAIEKDLNK